MNNQILISIPEPEFWEKTREIIRDVIETRSANQPRRDQSPGPDYLTRSEAANFLRITLTTLHAWQKAEIIQPRRIGGRVLFSRADLLEKIEAKNPKYQRRVK